MVMIAAMQATGGMARIYYMAVDDRVDALKWWSLLQIDLLLAKLGTQSAVAKKLDVERGYINQALNGKVLGPEMWCGVADALGLEPGEAWSQAINWWRTEGGYEWAVRRAKKFPSGGPKSTPTPPGPANPPSASPAKKPERLRSVK